MRILIIEDDPRIHQSLADDLRRQHHAVDVAEDGRIGLDFARTNVHDIILLDVLLPELDGLEVCRRLREEKSKVPILMITGLDHVGDKVGALDSGADDYIVKPFDLAELSARIRAVARRGGASLQPVLEHGGLRLEPSSGIVTFKDLPVPLTATEYTILEAFMRSPRQIFSRRMLSEKLSTFDDDSERDAIKTHITNIRRKFDKLGGHHYPIENVYGMGYRLSDIGS
jgi:two-component system, OmpR family, response regulator QseB